MSNKKQQGFTLIEVMIALFVLSVGMLGSSAMMLRGQSEAVKTNNDAIAAQMAQSVAEMVRSNIDGVEAGSYDALSSHAANPGCITSGCTGQNLAIYDSYLWGWMLDEYLTNASGTISGNGADSVFTITINWTEVQRTSATSGAEVTKTHTMIFQP